jgi:hypothetical protein
MAFCADIIKAIELNKAVTDSNFAFTRTPLFVMGLAIIWTCQKVSKEFHERLFVNIPPALGALRRFLKNVVRDGGIVFGQAVQHVIER